MIDSNKRIKRLVNILCFWTMFIGIGAILGGVAMLKEPSGETFGFISMLPYFQVLPFADILFQDFIFSGIALIIVNGVTNIIAFLLLINKKETVKRKGALLGMIFGITLMMWIIIQFIIFPLNFMSTIYFVFGFFQFLTGLLCLIRYKQNDFIFDEKEYKDIDETSRELVIYFSRTGYTKKVAYEIANKKKANIFEVKTTEKIDGDLGFWWAGRFGMHRWKMNLEKSDLDIENYREITICTPIWVFSISSPIRELCEVLKGKDLSRNIKWNYCFVHFMNAKFKKTANEMDKLIEVKHSSVLNYRCRFGNIKKLED